MSQEILLVEHTGQLRTSLRDWITLSFPETAILEVEDPAEAIELLSARSPGLVLVDIDGPDNDKLGTLRRLRAASRGAPVVALAMGDYDVQRRATLEAGASAYVPKAIIADLLPGLMGKFIRRAGRRGKKERKTVVCIEDEPDMITLIELTLGRGPFKVLAALDGQEGLDVTRRVRPDVVLLDLMLPGIDGLEVYRRMRADEELREIPVIVVSGMHVLPERMEELETVDFVKKPFAPEDLMRRVKNVAGAAL
jgi:DNA-binding response OmpR family regulator